MYTTIISKKKKEKEKSPWIWMRRRNIQEGLAGGKGREKCNYVENLK